jgi:hypothetical protein
MKRFKQTFLTTIIVFCTLTGIKAQEKYQFAEVIWTGSDYQSKVYTIINGKEFSEEKIELPKDQKNIFNSNPLFSKVNVLQGSGWEVMSFNQHTISTDMRVGVVYVAYLRKKL